MEEKLKEQEIMQIIEYLKVLSDSTESDGQVKELSKKFLGALDERYCENRHWPHSIANKFRINNPVELGSYGFCQSSAYEQRLQASPLDRFIPNLAG